MVFYQIIQFGQVRGTHHDEEKATEEVCNRIVAKAKKLVKAGDLLEGTFDVKVCREKGLEIDNFISGTDYVY